MNKRKINSQSDHLRLVTEILALTVRSLWRIKKKPSEMVEEIDDYVTSLFYLVGFSSLCFSEITPIICYILNLTQLDMFHDRITWIFFSLKTKYFCFALNISYYLSQQVILNAYELWSLRNDTPCKQNSDKDMPLNHVLLFSFILHHQGCLVLDH